MSSLARKSMLFMRDVYNLAANPGDLLLSPTSTSSHGYPPSQGPSSQFNPAYAAHQYPYPLATAHPAPVPPPPVYHYPYPGPQNPQPYSPWSGPLAPMSPPLPQQAALNVQVYPVGSNAPNTQPTTDRPPSPPSPVTSSSIPQPPYGNQSAHGLHQYSTVPGPPPTRRPPHHQHSSSWQSPTRPERHYQSLSNGSLGAHRLADHGADQEAAPHAPSSSRHSVSDGQWGVPHAAESRRRSLADNTRTQHIASGYMGSAPGDACALVSSHQHSVTGPYTAQIDTAQFHSPGYHELPAVAVRDVHHELSTCSSESGSDVLPGLPELAGHPADVPLSSTRALHSLSANPVELDARSCTVEAIELPASPAMAGMKCCTDASSCSTQRPRDSARYQRHYSTVTATTATTAEAGVEETAEAYAESTNELLAPPNAVELDSTPIFRGYSPTTTAITARDTSANHAPRRSNAVVDSLHPGSLMYRAYPGPSVMPLRQD